MEEVNINTLLALVRLGVIAPPGQKDGLIAARMTDHLRATTSVEFKSPGRAKTTLVWSWDCLSQRIMPLVVGELRRSGHHVSFEMMALYLALEYKDSRNDDDDDDDEEDKDDESKKSVW
ncbi:hypothetical protein ISN45_Aa08g004430 [Arabidopsis thaliana x Arabidopsis arenosa]|uniref:Uncharacterized protein n=1 Tax=Arabidopsis thaliana x Arabidopsis arenosa TaxID=1240361 RepID=A0A8T1XE46_9BRAS|nr:hypothetical protein ISN45_Aa08g004430 [Arabidopsis thaliana x Arabidopsis arenosa]